MTEPPESLIRHEAICDLMETARAAPDGDFVEVGVYKGGSARALWEVAKERARRLFLFDTFTGIPCRDEQFDTHHIGDFADTSVESVREAVPGAIIVEGVFPWTLANVKQEIGPIAIAHIDVDQYDSTLACCTKLGPLMAEGGIMVFDDYDVLNSARLAVNECFGGRVEMSKAGKARVRF